MRKCDLCDSDEIVTLLDNLSFSSEAEGEGKEWAYRLLKCRRCGLGFMDPKPSWKRVCSFYDKSYGGYTAEEGLFGCKGSLGSLKCLAVKSRYATYARRGLREIAQSALGLAAELITGRTVSFSLGISLHFPKDAKIFDLGYGQGNWLLSMSQLGYRNLDGYDIDANINSPSRLRSKGIKVSGGDFLKNDYEESSYDCVRISHVIEHLLQPREVLAKCYKMLKPGGLLVLECPCIDSWMARLSLRHFPGLHIPYHLHHHTPRSVTLLVQLAGFDVLKVKPHAVPRFIPIWVNAVMNDCGLRWIKIPSFLFLPFAPFYKLFCLITRKGDFQTMLCRKRLSSQ